MALDGRQNARRWHGDRDWRRGYQNTGWGHGTRHLRNKRWVGVERSVLPCACRWPLD